MITPQDAPFYLEKFLLACHGFANERKPLKRFEKNISADFIDDNHISNIHSLIKEGFNIVLNNTPELTKCERISINKLLIDVLKTKSVVEIANLVEDFNNEIIWKYIEAAMSEEEKEERNRLLARR